MGTNALGLSDGDYNSNISVSSIGTFNQNAGTVSTGVIIVGQGYGNASNGTYNLNGGTLSATGFLVGGNPGGILNFNLNGGTLQAKNAFAFGPTAGGRLQQYHRRDSGQHD